MTPVRLTPSSLKEGRWYEYLVRFALGGGATVFTGPISTRYGAAAGGLFLALPAIFCASATLIEKHEVRRKREAGLAGDRRGQLAAALYPAGAALGSLAMMVCVPKTLSVLMEHWNHLSWRNDRAAMFRSGRAGLAIQVEVAACG
jgi:hypothetical protein